jgi:acetyltransferase-like isoleucine patch superfamily enzyme
MIGIIIRARRKYKSWLLRQKVKLWRKAVLSNCAKCGTGLRVGGRTIVTKKTFLGNNVSFNGLIVGGTGEVHIGDNFHSGRDCLLITQVHNYEGTKIPYDETYIVKDIIIEDNVWLGTRVIVLGGITIGEGAIIQAGSVVVKSIPKYAIAGGHPAKVFSQRNVEHYEKLKAEKKFH